MTDVALGGLLGLLTALGLLLVVLRLPVLRRPRLEDRLAPYLRDAAPPSRLLTPRSATPFPTVERLLGPVISDGAAVLERALGGGASVRRRLEQAGGHLTLEEFRAQQLVWGALGGLGALVLSLLLLTTGTVRQPVALVVGCALAAVAGVLLRDRVLSEEVARRERLMLAEFPTVAEMLALAVAAGEGAVGALERVARISRGELAGELSRTLADARSGTSLVEALEKLSARTGLPALQRFVDGVAVAVERGTPLAEVLRAQAVDVREAGKRALLEAGGRKEIGMMVPVVFLILPVTVVFALYPGLVTLDLPS